MGSPARVGLAYYVAAPQFRHAAVQRQARVDRIAAVQRGHSRGDNRAGSTLQRRQSGISGMAVVDPVDIPRGIGDHRLEPHCSRPPGPCGMRRACGTFHRNTHEHLLTISRSKMPYLRYRGLHIPSAFVHAQHQVSVEAAFARIEGTASRWENESAMTARQHYTSPGKSSRARIEQARARRPHNH